MDIYLQNARMTKSIQPRPIGRPTSKLTFMAKTLILCGSVFLDAAYAIAPLAC
jgi:hypothetical protein